MSNTTATTHGAREHARAQAGTKTDFMPVIPPSADDNLPPEIDPETLVWRETIGPGGYAARILQRGTRIKLENLHGDACLSLLAYNADRTIERLNQADTVKVQWQAYLKQGQLLLSDMGRPLLSFMHDTCAKHDTFCAPSTEQSNATKYGHGANFTPYPNARDRFTIALAKFGLAKRDICPSVNLFKGVTVESDGSFTFNQNSSKPGDYLTLRADMNVLLVLANTPHRLDPRPDYNATPLRITAWQDDPAGPDDPIRNATPENQRAFANVDDYFNN